MSKINTAPIPPSSNRADNSANATGSSAWSRGPTDQLAASQSGNATPNRDPSASLSPAVNGLNGMMGAYGPSGASGPVNIGGHSRKGSLMVGGGADIVKGNLAFGTVDSPNPHLSSSPAAPSTTGAHLADTVKSFGTIEADASTDSAAVKAARRQSSLSTVASPVAAPARKLELHALFGRPSNPTSLAGTSPLPHSNGQLHDRRQSVGQGVNGYPAGTFSQAQNPHFRPPSNVSSRSPVPGQPLPSVFASQPQVQHGFRPSQPIAPNANLQQRPNGMTSLQPGMQRPGMMQPGIGQYGMHPGPQGPNYMMGYPQGFYYGGYEQQQYPVQSQWSHQGSTPMSPRSSQPQGSSTQPSPALAPAPLPPSSSAPSPAPTPPSRPPSLMGAPQVSSPVSSASVTPSRSQMAPPFAAHPQSPFGLSGGAASFTPRKPTAIKFTRPDGTAVDIKQAAAAAKGPTTAPSAGTTNTEGDALEPSKKKVPSLPVIVRVESEEQKKQRLAEEARLERIKKEEEAEARERQERKERLAKEEEKRKLAEEEQRQTEEENKRKAAEEEQRQAEEGEKRKAAEEERLQQQVEEKRKGAEEESRQRAEEEEKHRAAEEKGQAEIAKSKAEGEDSHRSEEEKSRMDQAFAAEQAAVKSLAEEREAIARSKRDAATETDVQAAHDAAQKAKELADEQRRALLTPSLSTSTSPSASPHLGSAGLPAKPVVDLPSRRPVPSPLEIASGAPENRASPAVSAISTAVPIVDLATVTYNSPFKSPSPELNTDAKPGKFRYDRDFLMQFMAVCREKPDGLPPLEEIGLEADTSSGFGNRSGRGGPRSSVGGTSRANGGAGLGIGGINRPMPGQGMGSFGMGNFSSGGIGSTRGTSSEDRYARSIAQSRIGSMGRSPSQQGGPPGMHGLPSMGSVPSRGSRSQRGTRRAPQPTFANPEPGVAPLVVSNNAWVTQRGAGGEDERSPAFIERKVKALLNKLTEEKFESISKQILEWANKSAHETDGMTLKLVIKLVFEKATDEAHWSSMYAKLCRLLLDNLDPNITETIDDTPVSGGILFRKYLLGRCQLDFENGWNAREDAATAAAAKSEEDRERLAQQADSQEGTEPAILSDEYYAAQKAKRRGLGLVQLIGELFKMEMLTKNVIRQCFVRLLGNIEDPDEEDIESTCKLLTTIGPQYETVSHDNMKAVFERLELVLSRDTIASRIRFMIMNVMDLRKNGWQSKNKQAGVMTIAEIHQQAAKEQAEKAMAASRDSMSRGGSRAGHSRRDGPQPGEWQSVNTSTRPLQRPADFTNIGRNINSAGLPSAPTFVGPQSTFKRKGNNAAATPPISRQASTTNVNMFTVLSGEATEAAAANAGSAEPAVTRKRLNLAPRTKPLPGGGEGTDEDEEEIATADEVAIEGAEEVSMSETQAQSKIDIDMNELWGDKGQGGSRNPEDLVHYFRALPEIRRPMLITRSLADVFRWARFKDAQVVGRGWAMALEQDVITREALVAGLEKQMPTLDDDSLDFPQAYKAIASIMRSLTLSADEIDAMVDKVLVEGSPRLTPKMKLDRALSSIDEESAEA